MAQPHYAVEYLGAITAEQGKMYTSASVITSYTAANMMKMKTSGVNVSVNNSDMFPVDLNDESYITSGHTYIFDRKCTIAIGKYVPIS
jgi:hypothetical protein